MNAARLIRWAVFVVAVDQVVEHLGVERRFLDAVADHHPCRPQGIAVAAAVQPEGDSPARPG
jgi:hypothetical protein